jgi:hypothetical protein
MSVCGVQQKVAHPSEPFLTNICVLYHREGNGKGKVKIDPVLN